MLSREGWEDRNRWEYEQHARLSCLGSPTMSICLGSTDSVPDGGKVYLIHILCEVKSRPLRQNTATFSHKEAKLLQSDLAAKAMREAW